MIFHLSASCILVALTVAIHSAGIVAVLRWILRASGMEDAGFWGMTWLLVRTAWCLIAFHLCEIALWALFFWRARCFPDLTAAAYFSGVTYTTVGYGDVVLPRDWWFFGPLEGLTGILACGLSTGFFFALVTRLCLEKTKRKE